MSFYCLVTERAGLGGVRRGGKEGMSVILLFSYEKLLSCFDLMLP